MDNENGLQQLTVRLPLNVKEKIENLAKMAAAPQRKLYGVPLMAV